MEDFPQLGLSWAALCSLQLWAPAPHAALALSLEGPEFPDMFSAKYQHAVSCGCFQGEMSAHITVPQITLPREYFLPSRVDLKRSCVTLACDCKDREFWGAFL